MDIVLATENCYSALNINGEEGWDCHHCRGDYDNETSVIDLACCSKVNLLV